MFAVEAAFQRGHADSSRAYYTSCSKRTGYILPSVSPREQPLSSYYLFAVLAGCGIWKEETVESVRSLRCVSAWMRVSKMLWCSLLLVCGVWAVSGQVGVQPERGVSPKSAKYYSSASNFIHVSPLFQE